MIAKEQYMLFLDESGVANLNNRGKYFVLSSVLIHKDDFEIIEGYFRLLKRKFLLDDYKILHATDLFEKTYMTYRRLVKPREVINPFLQELCSVLRNIPFSVRVYAVDKDKIRTKLGYKPSPGRKSMSFNTELPYELCAHEAIFDFTKFLINRRARGEILIESRLHSDGKFVSYFDDTRKASLPGGIANPLHREVNDRINSLYIANKGANNGGIELADLCAYIQYRKELGDPYKKMKLSVDRLNDLYAAIQKAALKDGRTDKLVVTLSV